MVIDICYLHVFNYLAVVVMTELTGDGSAHCYVKIVGHEHGTLSIVIHCSV